MGAGSTCQVVVPPNGIHQRCTRKTPPTVHVLIQRSREVLVCNRTRGESGQQQYGTMTFNRIETVFPNSRPTNTVLCCTSNLPHTMKGSAIWVTLVGPDCGFPAFKAGMSREGGCSQRKRHNGLKAGNMPYDKRGHDAPAQSLAHHVSSGNTHIHELSLFSSNG